MPRRIEEDWSEKPGKIVVDQQAQHQTKTNGWSLLTWQVCGCDILMARTGVRNGTVSSNRPYLWLLKFVSQSRADPSKKRRSLFGFRKLRTETVLFVLLAVPRLAFISRVVFIFDPQSRNLCKVADQIYEQQNRTSLGSRPEFVDGPAWC